MKNFAQQSHPHPSQGRWLEAARAIEFEKSGTSAYRLFTAHGGWAERFGSVALLSHKEPETLAVMMEGLKIWAEANNVVFERVFTKFLPRQNQERIAPVLAEGSADLPLETESTENGAIYALDFGAGYSAGLFIDQRSNRAFVRRVPPKKILNTFAYTCSFSVAAALAGAETTSVDLSRKSLDRGVKNFELNGLDATKHRFIADDVMDILPRLERRGDKFDCIILDPPTFSRGAKGRKFQVEEDFAELLSATLEVATVGARILLSTNCASLSRRALETLARHCMKLVRRNGTFHSEPDLPDIPSSSGASTLWLTIR